MQEISSRQLFKAEHWVPLDAAGSWRSQGKRKTKEGEENLSQGRAKRGCNYAGGTSSPFREGLSADLFSLSLSFPVSLSLGWSTEGGLKLKRMTLSPAMILLALDALLDSAVYLPEVTVYSDAVAAVFRLHWRRRHFGPLLRLQEDVNTSIPRERGGGRGGGIAIYSDIYHGTRCVDSSHTFWWLWTRLIGITKDLELDSYLNTNDAWLHLDLNLLT